MFDARVRGCVRLCRTYLPSSLNNRSSSANEKVTVSTVQGEHRRQVPLCLFFRLLVSHLFARRWLLLRDERWCDLLAKVVYARLNNSV